MKAFRVSCSRLIATEHVSAGRWLCLAAFLIFGPATMAPTRAGVVQLATPSGLNPGDHFRFVFVTDNQLPAQSSDISTYDTFVNVDAGGATYNGNIVSWQAIGSTATVDAIDHVGSNLADGAVYLPDGTLVADSDTTDRGGLFFFRNISNPINETISSIVYSTVVWTGSNLNGTGARDPGATPPYDYTLGQSQVAYGLSSSASWSRMYYLEADPGYGTASLYGISEVLTVPTAVPEPSTVVLAAIVSVVGLGGAVARKRKLTNQINAQA